MSESASSNPAHAAALRAVFVDATAPLADELLRQRQPDDVACAIHRDPDVGIAELPKLLAGATIALIDHTALPTAIARECRELRHVVFLGSGARSYMQPEELAELGIAVHSISGYGDTAVAECTMALLWAAARDLALMDRELRAGRWVRREGLQLGGRRIGLAGFGGIAREVARLAQGIGMQVLAWNRTPKTHPGVEFVALERLLAESEVLSLHLALNDATRHFLSRERIASMRPGAILINTARGALVDEAAMLDALRSGQLRHAGLDVYAEEPLPPGHALTTLPNVTLAAHSAFRTQEANARLIAAALAHCRRIAQAP
jgi:D-3-phosphoglycerate dehydrogenase